VEHFDSMPLPTAPPANSALIPADALGAGTRLEDYEIDSVIARSAVALVYRALDRRNGKVVAIKEFLPIGLATRGANGQVAALESIHEQDFQHGRQIFLEQARTLEKCEHPSLMRVLRVMEREGTVYKVMPYAPGPTLLEFRQKMTAAPTEQVLRAWLEALMGALAQLHEKGQLHGAVSPGNILMLPDERPVLLDSDAVHAAILSDRTRCMIASLEPCFAPQEQCEPAPDRPLGPWTDLYALAATLRFCVSGQLPGAYAPRHQGVAVGSAAKPTHTDAPPWMALLDACLAEAGKDRPQSLAQLKRLLPFDEARASSTKAGPARLLSVPLARSPAKAALGAGRDVAPLPLQQSLPLASPSPPPGVAEDQEPLDRATTQPETDRLPGAPASGPSTRSTSSGAQNTARSRIRMAGIAATLVVAAVAMTSIALLRKQDTSDGGDAVATTAAVPPPAPAAQHTATNNITPIAPRESVAPVALPPSVKADAASTVAVRPAATSPPSSKPGAKVEKGKAVAPVATGKPAGARAPARASSPRQVCAGRERYALLQCMNEQCAKSAWSKHEQCVRLRRERKL
jgi:serine/threonine protein kinase